MDEAGLKRLLEAFKASQMSIDEAAERLRELPYADLGFSKVDHHRELRSGLAESVYAPGKTPSEVAEIVGELLLKNTGAILVTRASRDQYEALDNVAWDATFHERSGMIVVREASSQVDGVVTVVSAGTADAHVAEECFVTLDALGIKATTVSDVGVAGIHRLFGSLDEIRAADVVIVVAGMEGALASVVAGLVSAPVIGVPTSVGYGAGAGGIAPLLTMMNSCAPGVAVVNIDNGYGAAVFAWTILAGCRDPL